MNKKQFKNLESFYLDVVKGLFSSKETFKEFLEKLSQECLNDIDETIYLNDIKELLECFIDSPTNTTNKNILVKHLEFKTFDAVIYNLHQSQSYKSFVSVENKFIMNNCKYVGNLYKVSLGGLLESTQNTKITLYFKD